MTDLAQIHDAVLSGNSDGCAQTVRNALDAGASAEEILNQALIPAMHEVGVLFERQEFYVPEMLVAAKAMQAGLDILKPLLAEAGIEPIARVAVGTVQGDLHDIGKNLVIMMLEGAGFEIIDLGVDVPPQGFVSAIEEGAQLIGMSALLTTTMEKMITTIEAVDKAGVRDKAKIIIGGAPVTSEYAASIGADGYASDASQAVTVSKELLGLD